MSPRKKVLFVCDANRLRSPTAIELYQHNEDLEVKSAGISREIAIRVTSELLEWADIIFVFEKRHRNLIHKEFNGLYWRKSITCLYVPDLYDYMDPDLIYILKQRLKRYIGPAKCFNER